MIIGDRVRLRALERNELDKFVEWLNDPEVQAGIGMILPFSLAEEERWFEEMLKRPPQEHVMAIEIKKATGWQMVGSCGFHAVDWRNRSADIGSVIGDKTSWNQGFGTEVIHLMLQHGFKTLNLNRIALEVFENNARAIRVYEKAGLIHEGRKRQAMYKNGLYYDVHIMSVLRSEWEE